MDDMQTLDWERLERFIAERKPVEVSAGILNDWYWTAATVYENGAWTGRDRAYVTSYWAQPGFKATMGNGDVIEVAASRPERPEETEARLERMAENKKHLAEFLEKARRERAESSGRGDSNG